MPVWKNDSFPTNHHMCAAQNETRGVTKPQVLVHVSTYQGNPFWNSGFLEPQPYVSPSPRPLLFGDPPKAEDESETTEHGRV